MSGIMHESDKRELGLLASGAAGSASVGRGIASLGSTLWIHDLCEVFRIRGCLGKRLASNSLRAHDAVSSTSDCPPSE